ncbi:Cysteine and histidine-rich domain-containing protein [Orchesella cincta]|uniref:Cysteine and histidine-rich domain-containing protein n=1 Tax=Orchesella cincta TaxID=48709 RepID=A0A1D2M0V9_ORCCI|nr:Cysteine and histidine-rich domain-containing protein [Orchesella cincta]
MAEEEPSLLCYNKGCGQTFKESENTETSCRFHPGDHFFHDAYKGWTCCNRKTVDFTECTPAQPAYKPMERPPVDSPLSDVMKELSDSLKNQTLTTAPSSNGIDVEEDKAQIIPGVTQCVNNGCKVTYQGPETDLEACDHHPGVPIFHEGLKFWSCCQKRTTEFEVFMNQKGCTAGTHVWIKPKENSHDQGGAKVIKCRNDWHQTGSHVIMYIYAKKFDPNRSEVKVNGVKLQVEIYFPEEDGYFREEWILAGANNNTRRLLSANDTMKFEIKLKKAEPVSWKQLALPKEQQIIKTDEIKNEYSVGVDVLDLSDL